MLENELLLIVRFQDNRVLVETLDSSGQLHAAEKIDGGGGLVFAYVIKKNVLDILNWFFHSYYLLVVISIKANRAVSEPTTGGSWCRTGDRCSRSYLRNPRRLQASSTRHRLKVNTGPPMLLMD